MSDPTDGLPRPISWGEWRDLKERVATLEEFVAKLEGILKIDTSSSTSSSLVPLPDPIPPVRKTRGTRLSENWVPRNSTIAKMANELKVNVHDLRRAHLKFVDYFLSVPGVKGTKLEWDRTWCNWMRTEVERGTLLPGRTGTVADKAQGWMELGNAATD